MMGQRRLVSERFLVWVLTSHWGRIRVLNLTILDEDLFRNAGAITTSILQRAAPNLEYFRMVFRHGLPAVFSSPSFVLFANKAPRLVQYRGMMLPYRLDTPWVSQIRVLHLQLDSPLMVRELVFALQFAVSLQALSIEPASRDVSLTIRSGRLYTNHHCSPLRRTLPCPPFGTLTSHIPFRRACSSCTGSNRDPNVA